MINWSGSVSGGERVSILCEDQVGRSFNWLVLTTDGTCGEVATFLNLRKVILHDRYFEGLVCQQKKRAECSTFLFF